MLKRLAIPTVAVLLVAAIAVAVYYQQRHAISKGYDIKCTQPEVPSLAPAEFTCKVQPGQNAEQGHPGWNWFYVLIAWPEGITAWLLLLTLGAVGWQSWETRKASQIALGSAAPNLVLFGFDFADEGRPNFDGVLQFPMVKVVMKNYGGTPAILKTIGLRYSCGGIKKTDFIPVCWHFEDGAVVESDREYTFDDAVCTPCPTFSEGEIAAIIAGEKILSIAGCVTYGSIVDPSIRELRFCRDLVEFRKTSPSLWVDSDLGDKFRRSTQAEKKQPHNPN